MQSVTRTDLLIGAVVLAVLAALVGLGMANRHRPVTQASASVTALGAAAAAPPTTTSTTLPSPASAGSGTPAAPPFGVPTPTSTSTTATTAPGGGPPPLAGPVTAVGDSIMLDIQPYLVQDVAGVSVDGMVSRQFETGIAVVQADRAAGTLGSILVVELGTNGSVTPADVDAMMQAAAGVKRVVFVNLDVPRPWEAPDNAVLAAGVARYPGVAVLADWYTLSAPHPEWFTADQVHLNPSGAQAMAALIAQDV
jgi:hypothetical protein